jgi:hypothetical protein
LSDAFPEWPGGPAGIVRFRTVVIASAHLYLTRSNPEYPKEKPPDAMGERRAVSRNSSSFSRQTLHGAVDNGVELRGVPLLASPCESSAYIVNAEPGGVAVWFLRRLGVSDFQHESLHDEFLDDIVLAGVAFWL